MGSMGDEGEDMGEEKPGLLEAKAFGIAVKSGNPEKILTAFKDLMSACGDESETETEETED